MTRPLTIAACLALASLSSAALAQEQPAGESAPTETAAPQAATAAPAPTGNADEGRMLTYTCIGCDGIGGYRNIYPDDHVPMSGGECEDQAG